MSVTIDSIAEKILSNDIDKSEALKSFDSLSDYEKNILISKLKFNLSDKGKNAAPADDKPLLKPVSERGLSEDQQKYVDELCAMFEKFAPKSKQNALIHQEYFVDQRKTANLKRGLKNLQYHITYDRGEGAYLYDIDGNRYVDVTGDNGVNLFGHQPERIKKAIVDRASKGFPLVGYTEELFVAAQLFTELTQSERVMFTQSGTEAVMWAVRIARAATGRNKLVIFDGSYHGLSDTVLAARDPEGNSMAMGLGMLQEYADQIIVLEYGAMEGLETIAEHADEIACVLVEPIQSRHPLRQPKEFLKELRKLTLEKDICLIFDEMITGFRVGPRGAQGFYGIKSDMATYGKVPGGGMPTGMIAGMAKYMDYVDGGTWRFDDDSMPKLKRTLVAGTHTRNPLKLAACKAVLEEIKARCGDDLDCKKPDNFYNKLNKTTKDMAEEINAFCREKRVPFTVDYFSSLFKFRGTDDPNGVVKELFIFLLRMNGVETSVSGNFFLNTEHTPEHIRQIIEAVKKSINTLIEKGFYVEPDPAEIEAAKKAAEQKAQRAIKKAGAPKPATAAVPAVSAGNDQLEALKNLILSDLRNATAGGN
ncbi:aminotransferase class III-fold pyridoxal phosphate-dependent enzyme [Paraneptunicella aestuarii]|uniref:aspartate aminotransferase family protein n=1 Tax=Paraneptunicella aestuarii TaxID=2831148 RepID=UPI001E46FA3C|nr:aminotransferase class III-fold pyridoxal phosphate-dependent enzyme [Paraneptunicella aestuarii]UAA37474.1 aminotransferase class III-fold pyridoxal phosphate-dependent enzyme [Paraneptunicella aestuarii]